MDSESQVAGHGSASSVVMRQKFRCHSRAWATLAITDVERKPHPIGNTETPHYEESSHVGRQRGCFLAHRYIMQLPLSLRLDDPGRRLWSRGWPWDRGIRRCWRKERVNTGCRQSRVPLIHKMRRDTKDASQNAQPEPSLDVQ